MDSEEAKDYIPQMFADTDLDKAVKEGRIIAICSYLPYSTYGYSNDSTPGNGGYTKDKMSLDILNIKQCAKKELQDWKKLKVEKAVQGWLKLCSSMLAPPASSRDCILVGIPSSTQDNKEHGMTRFLTSLAESGKIPYSAATLLRTESVEKAATTNARNKEDHLRTLQVDVDMVKNKHVLLIDDVTTSGASKDAAMELLRGAEASSVVFLALGQTLPGQTYVSSKVPPVMTAQFPNLFDGGFQQETVSENGKLLYCSP